MDRLLPRRVSLQDCPHQPEKQPMDPSQNTPLTSIGIDIGKEVFHLVGFGTDGKIAFRRKIKRLALVETFKKLPPCVVGWRPASAPISSAELASAGHEPRIIPAIYVKPFVKGQKNDYNDAEAIAEAALRPNLRIVREKTQDQLDLQACHRVRSRLVSRRTATINQIRAFLIEQGIAVRTGPRSPAQLAVRDPQEPAGRDIAAHERSDRWPLRRLALARRADRDHYRRDRGAERIDAPRSAAHPRLT